MALAIALSALAMRGGWGRPGLPRSVDHAGVVFLGEVAGEVESAGLSTWVPVQVRRVLKGDLPQSPVRCYVSGGRFGGAGGLRPRPGTGCLALAGRANDGRLQCVGRCLIVLPPGAADHLVASGELAERLRPVLVKAVGDGSGVLAADALAVLGILPKTRATLGLLSAATAPDRPWATRDSAWQALLDCGAADLPHGLRQHLDADLPDSATQAWVGLIQELGQGSGVRFLPGLLEVRTPAIRAAAAQALASARWSAAIPALLGQPGGWLSDDAMLALALAMGADCPLPKVDQRNATAWRDWWDREGQTAFSGPRPPVDPALTKPLLDLLDGPPSVPAPAGPPDSALAGLSLAQGEGFEGVVARLSAAGAVVAWPDQPKPQPQPQVAGRGDLSAWLIASAQRHGWRVRRAEAVIAMAPPPGYSPSSEAGVVDRAEHLLDWLDGLSVAQYGLARRTASIPWGELDPTQRSQWLSGVSPERTPVVAGQPLTSLPEEALELVLEPSCDIALRVAQVGTPILSLGSQRAAYGTLGSRPDTALDAAGLLGPVRAARSASQPEALRLGEEVPVTPGVSARFAAVVSISDLVAWLGEHGLRCIAAPEVRGRRLRLALPPSVRLGQAMQAAAWATDSHWRNVDDLWYLGANHDDTPWSAEATRTREPGRRRGLRERLLRHATALWPDSATLPPAVSGYEDVWLPLSRLTPVWRELARQRLLVAPERTQIGLPAWHPAALDHCEVSFRIALNMTLTQATTGPSRAGRRGGARQTLSITARAGNDL